MCYYLSLYIIYHFPSYIIVKKSMTPELAFLVVLLLLVFAWAELNLARN